MKADCILSPQPCKHLILQEFHMGAPLPLAWGVRYLIAGAGAATREARSALTPEAQNPESCGTALWHTQVSTPLQKGSNELFI